MIKSTHLLFPLCMGAMLSLGACATVPNAEQAAATSEKAPEKVTVAESTKQATTETDSEKLICKRQATAGSNFKRKVCATAEQWKAAAEDGRRTTGDIQRKHAPGISN